MSGIRETLSDFDVGFRGSAVVRIHLPELFQVFRVYVILHCKNEVKKCIGVWKPLIILCN